ncbi:MAG: ATP-binding protein [Streptosporangiaceae bacterium]|jgi:anti-sigma regulatory factor (Ser/Thr protein kinase)
MRERATLPPLLISWQNCTRSFPGRPDQISAVRALLADFLAGFPAADEAILLASELCTNAVTYSASGQPGGTFTVRAQLTGTYLHAQVEDQGSTWDGSLEPADPPHGLYLLRTLSTACGTFPGICGWVTWFTITNATTPAQ